MSYAVSLSREAELDLERLFELVLERELYSATGDAAMAQRALDTIHDGLKVLERFPFTCRKAPQAMSPPGRPKGEYGRAQHEGIPVSSFVRELLIPFGRSGYVALFEIVDAQSAIVGAVRHQREDDYR